MSVKEFSVQLKDTIENIKNNGTTAIDCEALIAYLTEVVNSPSLKITEIDLEKYKSDLELWVAQSTHAHESQLEMFRSTITAGQNAIRSSFLLNGGSALALLAFISHLTENQPDKVAVFADSLIPFVVGVLAITVTSGFTYLSQWFYAGGKPWMEKTGLCLNIGVILLGLSSYGFFVWGMCRAYFGFKLFV